jgi:N-acetyl-1-D-myo-inositol-2-amino-2-deoxy-alpha-D-glucopyranoside deacetylase
VLAVIRPRARAEAEVGALVPPAGLRPAPAGDLGFLVDDELVDVAVPTARWSRQREAALRAHATQITVFDGGFALSNRIAQPLPAFECYRVLAGGPGPRGPDGTPAADVFAGLP